MALEAVEVQGREYAASYRTLSVHEARALLLYGIERRLPLQLVTARAGRGKSRLLRALSRTCGDAADLLLVSDLPPTLAGIVQQLLVGLSEPLRPTESTLERLARLAKALAARRRSGRLVALLVDDAHRLAPPHLLELGLFMGSDSAGSALLPIILAGRPELAATLETPLLDPVVTQLATHIELQRPLAAEALVEPEPLPGPPPRPRWPLAVAFAATLLAVLGVGLLWQRSPRPIAQPSIMEPRPVPASVGLTAAEEEIPLSESPLLPTPGSGAVTASDVRSVIAAFRHALETQDAERIASLFAPRARQNGVRGRDAIARTYAYRFSRIDAPMLMESPRTLTLRGGVGHATTRFRTGYRDASGTPGELEGVLSWRIVRQGDQVVIADLDYAYEVAAQ